MIGGWRLIVTEAVAWPALRPHPASRASIAKDPARMIRFSSKGRYCMPIRLLLQLTIGSDRALLETAGNCKSDFVSFRTRWWRVIYPPEVNPCRN